MKKTNTDWPKEFASFSKNGFSRSQYCKERQLKYTTFCYHWERRFKRLMKHSLLNCGKSFQASVLGSFSQDLPQIYKNCI
ncbi:IS66 family insertion sequence element accessory protein TnpA [Leptospira weilii]|uniref:IS66 family insertion sequence element accessory protein TnpA n=1 Tax=Leptospira weilii TaxID=28184 RepID=UPI003B9847F7